MENNSAAAKKLYRSRRNRTFLGILGGLGEYFGVDPVMLRLVFVILLVLTAIAPFLLIYFAAYFIIPLEPEK